MMVFAFLPDWSEILPRDGGHVVAVYGGGGKTSLIEAMAAALVADGVPVLATTTTRTEPLAWPGLRLLTWDVLVAEASLLAEGAVFVGRDCALDTPATSKWQGITPAEVDALGGLAPEHVVLVEADGSAGLPVKIHRDDEPLLPSRTSLAVPVVGLAALGEDPRTILHRHGELEAPWLGLEQPETWGWEHMRRLLAAPDGYLGKVPDGVPILPAFLQMDSCDDGLGLFALLGEVMDELGVPAVVIGDTSGPEPRLRTAVHESDADRGVCRPDAGSYGNG